jgi:uncharacterized protein YutE (UPF0331/DUF86 family)
MTPSKLRAKVIVERSSWVKNMLASVRSLPLDSLETFRADPRNVAAAESYLRRALEALFDLGRHILGKGFGRAISEYKEISRALVQQKVMSEENGRTLNKIAGYRNRMVHYYQEISSQELYEILTHDLKDIEDLFSVILKWIQQHPEIVDQEL